MATLRQIDVDRTSVNFLITGLPNLAIDFMYRSQDGDRFCAVEIGNTKVSTYTLKTIVGTFTQDKVSGAIVNNSTNSFRDIIFTGLKFLVFGNDTAIPSHYHIWCVDPQSLTLDWSHDLGSTVHRCIAWDTQAIYIVRFRAGTANLDRFTVNGSTVTNDLSKRLAVSTTEEATFDGRSFWLADNDGAPKLNQLDYVQRSTNKTIGSFSNPIGLCHNGKDLFLMTS